MSQINSKKNPNTLYVPQHFPDNLAVYWIMWKNMAQAGRPQMAI
jgi:hypothetical protein